MFSVHQLLSKKLVILGLAESGKSTMINGVIKGLTPRLGDKYDATINYQRLTKKVCDTEIQIFDLGGQTRFLDKFTGELAEFVFSNIENGAFIFVIEPLKVAELSRAKYYFELSLQKLDQYSKDTHVYVFLNKIDLIPKNMIIETSNMIKEYLLSEVSRDIRYYETTVFSESVYLAIGEILANMIGIQDKIGFILKEFVDTYSNYIDQIQVLTREGAILLVMKNKKKKENLELYETKRLFDESLNMYLSKDEKTEKIVQVEFNDEYLTLINFLDNELVVMLLVSKKGLETDYESSVTIYDNLLSLSNQIRMFTQ